MSFGCGSSFNMLVCGVLLIRSLGVYDDFLVFENCTASGSALRRRSSPVTQSMSSW